MFKKLTQVAMAATTLIAMTSHAGVFTGPSSSQSSYITPLAAGVDVTSILTTGDSVGGYMMGGIPDGMGAYDNLDGTFTLLMNHELGSSSGVVRAHGAKGAYVSEWVINKSDFSVVSGRDLIQNVYGWNVTSQSSNLSPSLYSFNRFCSADLALPSAFYNASTGKGTTARLFLSGEEGGANGYAVANVATGAAKGNTYILGKFNTTTDGSGRPSAVGGWENLLANPLAQDKTVVIGNNDGGTGIFANSLGVYVGTKTNVGSDADKAGLTNGSIKFINVNGSLAEIANTSTRTTGIANGTRFSLGDTTSTAFSRPEDGAWNPNNPNEYYFVTTDQLDKTDLAGQAQRGGSRLWRLTFDDITNPETGGKVDVLIDSSAATFARGAGQNLPNMLDNMTVLADGTLILQEDTGNAEHNAKMWRYNPTTGELSLLSESDRARFGFINASGVFTAGTLTKDEENSGSVDITSILGRNDGRIYMLNVTQNHAAASGPNATALVEGGQLQVVSMPAIPEPETYALSLAALSVFGLMARRRTTR